MWGVLCINLDEFTSNLKTAECQNGKYEINCSVGVKILVVFWENKMFSDIFLLTSTTITKNMCIALLSQIFKMSVISVTPKYRHIHHQRIQINKNQQLFFVLSQILCFTVFLLFLMAILDRRHKPRMLVCNPV